MRAWRPWLAAALTLALAANAGAAAIVAIIIDDLGNDYRRGLAAVD